MKTRKLKPTERRVLIAFHGHLESRRRAYEGAQREFIAAVNDILNDAEAEITVETHRIEMRGAPEDWAIIEKEKDDAADKAESEGEA